MRFDPFVEVTVDPTKPIRKVFAREFSDFQSSIGSKLAIDRSISNHLSILLERDMKKFLSRHAASPANKRKDGE